MPILSDNGDDDKSYISLIAYLAGIINSYIFDFLLRARVSMNLSFFYVYQTPVPREFAGNLAKRIERISAVLSSPTEDYSSFASNFNIQPRRLTMKERIELLAELNALVARHYGLDRDELSIVLYSFEGFKEDEKVLELGQDIAWSDEIIRKLNGEVRKRVLSYFDTLSQTMEQ
jgi:hypothetical protein